MLQRKNIISFSGGKDSTALLLLALELNADPLPVFADTGHEHRCPNIGRECFCDGTCRGEKSLAGPYKDALSADPQKGKFADQE